MKRNEPVEHRQHARITMAESRGRDYKRLQDMVMLEYVYHAGPTLSFTGRVKIHQYSKECAGEIPWTLTETVMNSCLGSKLKVREVVA